MFNSETTVYPAQNEVTLAHEGQVGSNKTLGNDQTDRHRRHNRRLLIAHLSKTGTQARWTHSTYVQCHQGLDALD